MVDIGAYFVSRAPQLWAGHHIQFEVYNVDSAPLLSVGHCQCGYIGSPLIWTMYGAARELSLLLLGRVLDRNLAPSSIHVQPFNYQQHLANNTTHPLRHPLSVLSGKSRSLFS